MTDYPFNLDGPHSDLQKRIYDMALPIVDAAIEKAVAAERQRIRAKLLGIVTEHIHAGTDVVYDRLLVAIREWGDDYE